MIMRIIINHSDVCHRREEQIPLIQMKKYVSFVSCFAMLGMVLTACGGKDEATGTSVATVNPSASQSASTAASASPASTQAASTTRTIQYLGKEYKIAGASPKIIVASFEAMEDAAVLGVKPVGTVTDGVKVPDYMAKAMEGAADVGNRQQPSAEAILKLKPDVILGSSKFQPAVVEQMEKIAPMLPVSHIATNWSANLKMLAEITGKEEQAKQILSKYEADVKAAKEKLTALRDKKVMMIRIRTGNINLYPADVYFNPSLYADLGLTVPEEIKSIKAQEIVALEKFAEMNPDYLFVQFAEGENKDQPKAMEDLQKNPIWKTIKAVKNNKVFVNSIDPYAQGGTSWSKINFLDTAVKKLTE